MGLGRGSIQRSSCTVERGLYVLRYASTRLETAPVANVGVASGPIQLLLAPGRTSAELTHPGQSLIIIAESSGVIEISVTCLADKVSPDVSFSLDLLDRGITRTESSATTLTSQPTDDVSRDGSHLLIDAHVSRIGDVRVVGGEWIAGPNLPLPIEGLSVAETRHPANLEIQVQSATRPGMWSNWCGSGQFVGTRQRAEPLTGIRLRLRQVEQVNCVIVAEALFLGSPVIRKSGSYVEFVSQDPLVGLKVDVSLKGFPHDEVSRRSGDGVQVFRAA